MKKVVLSAVALMIASVGLAQENSSGVVQLGVDNESTVVQTGYDNLSGVVQAGYMNVSTVDQLGDQKFISSCFCRSK